MPKNTNKTVVYSALEVANICGVVNQTAINWIRNGYLSAFCTPGGQYRVYLDDLIAFMTKRNMRIPVDLQKLYDSEKQQKSILVVDDDKGINSVIAKYISVKFPDLAVFQAFDGFDAGAQLVNKKPSCVLLDLDLPGIDGFELCRHIHTSEEYGKPVVFIITAMKEAGVAERVKKMGAVEFFTKPLDLVEIAAAVKKHLDE